MTIEKRTEPATVTRSWYICNICGDDSEYRMSHCDICCRHVCNECESKMKCRYTDFGVFYCDECYKMKSVYDIKIIQIENNCERLITVYENLIEKQEAIMNNGVTKLKEEWKNEALSLVNNDEN